MKTKKVFLVDPPCQDNRYNRFPLGLGYIAANISDICDVKVVILENNKKSHITFLNDLIFEKVDIVGISCTSLNVIDVFALTREIKLLNPNIIIVLGGPQATAQPKETILYDETIDYLIVGQGEEVFKKFIVSLERDEQVDNIEGLVNNNTFSLGKTSSAVACSRIDGGNYDYPMKHLPIKPKDVKEKYRLRYVPGSILTSRGCANQCSFCTVSLGKQLCFTPIEKVVKEIRFLHEEYGVTELIINDADFFANTHRAIEIIRRIKNIGYIRKISLNSCVHSIIKIKDKLDSILNGMEWEFEIGIESVCPEQLVRYNKRVTAEQNCSALDTLFIAKQKHNIKIDLDMILFDPYSSMSDFSHFFEFVEKYNLESSEYEDILTSITFLFPGTKLREQAIMDGLAKNTLGTASFVFQDSNVAILYSSILWFSRFVMPEIDEIRNQIDAKIANNIAHIERIALFKMKKKYNRIMFAFFKEAFDYINDGREINELLKNYKDRVLIAKENLNNVLGMEK